MLGPDEFARLQERLVPLFQEESATAVRTVVVVPSMSEHADELRKVPGVVHFEQRLLFVLRLLRRPATRIVYVTSQAIDPAIVDYSIDLVAGSSRESARERLVLIDCGDDSWFPLSGKILRRPDVVDAILAAVGDPAAAWLVTYNGTELERDLALRLGLPMFSCDPRLASLGSKSGGRKVLRAAGVPVLAGFEDLRDEHDLVAALARVKSEHPGLEQATVKLDNGFAGMGNAVFRYAGAPVAGLDSWVAGEIAERLAIGGGDDWAGYRDRFRNAGGVVEAHLPTSDSPSVQVEIRPGGDVRVVSTHDQLLGGPFGQTFVGCVFPARERYRRQVGELALRAGRALAAEGVLGQCGVDFVVAGEQAYALEINLRMSGTTAPFLLLHGLVGGDYDPASGDYLAPDGRPRYYTASDRIQDDRFRSLRLPELVEIASRRGLHYDPESRTGACYFALGGLPEFGRLGIVAVGASPGRAQRCYDALVAALRSA